MDTAVREHRRWKSRPTPLLLRFWPIARTSAILVLRRRIFWIFLFLGFLNFFVHSSIIYLVNVQLRSEDLPPVLRLSDSLLSRFTDTARGLRGFLGSQNVVVMLLLGFASSILVGNDFRLGAVSFYLARPITRREYFAGKLAAAFSLSALLTLLPGVILFIEDGAFRSSWTYYADHARILAGILVHGTLICAVMSSVLLGVASLLRRTIPVLMVWGGIFVFLPAIGRMLRRVMSLDAGSDVWEWGLLSLWSALRWIASVAYGYRVDRYTERLPAAIGVVCLWVAVSVAVFWWQVRRTDAAR